MPPSQSIDPGTVISNALRIYADQARVLIPAALVVFAIEAVVAYALRGVLAIVAGAIALVASTFYQGMVVELVRDVQDGRRDSSVGDLFRAVQPVVLPLIAVSLLAGLGIAIGFILLIIPGLYLLTIWSVVAPVMVIERPGVFAAFRRSRELVRGYGWQVFGVIVVIFLIGILAGLIGGVLAAGLSDAGQTIVEWAVNALTAPLTALLASVLYFSLRYAKGEARVPSGPPGPEVPTDVRGWQPPTAGA